MSDIDKQELRRLAEAFPDYEWDSNQTEFFNGPSGESLGGEPTGFYCVYGPAFEIDDDLYDGPTLVEACPLDQARFICEAKATILALLDELERHDAKVAELEAEIERLRKSCRNMRDWIDRTSFHGTDAVELMREADQALGSEAKS